MKRLHNWLMGALDAANNWNERRIIAGLFGLAALLVGLLLLWGIVAACEKLGLNQ